MPRHLLIHFLLLCVVPAFAIAKPSSPVIVTVKPLYALTAAVMGDTGTPHLLVTGTNSLHDYQLKPSQMALLHHARLVFYVDRNFETFLRRALDALPKTDAPRRRIALAKERGLTVLPRRSGGVWEKENDRHHAHTHAAADLHLWLDIDNAIVLVHAIARELSAAFPEHAPDYAQNAEARVAQLKALDTRLRAQLAPLADRPFIVFHDAYQYVERRYGLRGVGSITLDPHESPSPARLRAIRQTIRDTGAVCVFREPQLSDTLVATVTEGLEVRSATLDPEGVGMPESATLYETLMEQLAGGLKECLSAHVDQRD